MFTKTVEFVTTFETSVTLIYETRFIESYN